MTDTLPVAFTIEADFDKDGTYETDLTGYVNDLRSGAFTIQRGMGADGLYRVSELSLRLDNISGIFSPLYGAGSLYGSIEQHIPIRVTADHDSVSYTRWTGYIEEWDFEGAGPGQVAIILCRDLAAFFTDSDPVHVTASTARDTDAALVAIFDAIGLGAGDRDFADGVQDLPMHYVAGAPAMQAIMDVVDSEMGGRCFVQADNTLRFEARNTRLGTTVDDTWGDGTNIQAERVSVKLDPKDLVTSVTARSTYYRRGQADTQVFEFGQNMFTKPSATSIALAAGEIYERTFQANSVYYSLTALEAVYDYTANDSQDGTGTDRTSSLAATVTDLGGHRFRLKLVNTHSGTIYVTKFRMRAEPVEFFADRAEASFSLSVSGMKAGKTLQFDVPFAGDTGGKLRDYAYQVLRTGRYPLPVLTVVFPWDHDDTIAAMLSAEIGWLVKFADKAPSGNAAWASGADDWWYVEALRDDIVPGGLCRTTVTLVPSSYYRNLDSLVFDTFVRADASGDLGTAFCGAAWANDTGFDIASNAARANTDTLCIPDLDLGASVTDSVWEVTISDIAAGDEVGLHFRKADADNYYRAYVDKGSNEVILEKVVATAVTELSSPALTVGTSHELRVMNQATRIRVWVDRKLYIDTTDAALSAGTKGGIMARNASGSATFTNLYGEGL